MARSVEYNIEPSQFLSEIGWTFRKRSSWLDVKVCPFCRGGDNNDLHTFAVHGTDGNYVCQRSTCGEAGSFWKLIETAGRDPRNYMGRQAARPRAKKGRGFVYGR